MTTAPWIEYARVIPELPKDEWVVIAHRTVRQGTWSETPGAPLTTLQARMAERDGRIIMATRFDGPDRFLMIRLAKLTR